MKPGHMDETRAPVVVWYHWWYGGTYHVPYHTNVSEIPCYRRIMLP